MICKVKHCSTKNHCKGFCRSCYNKFYKGRIDLEGNPIGDYVPKLKKTVCRFPNCGHVGTSKSCLRNGLCNRHRKWAEKGIINKDTCEILLPNKMPKVMGGYIHCKISGCLNKHKAKGFCVNHYRSFLIYKTIDKDGRFIGKRKMYDYKQDKCWVRTCTRKGRLSKGFCMYHYGLFKKGYYSEYGMLIKEIDFKTREEWNDYFKKLFRKKAKEKAIKLTWEGETKTIKQWSRLTKIKAATIKSRYKAGWDIEKIMTRKDFRKERI